MFNYLISKKNKFYLNQPNAISIHLTCCLLKHLLEATLAASTVSQGHLNGATAETIVEGFRTG